MMDISKGKYKPFSNGTEQLMWQESNCFLCANWCLNLDIPLECATAAEDKCCQLDAEISMGELTSKTFEKIVGEKLTTDYKRPKAYFEGCNYGIPYFPDCKLRETEQECAQRFIREYDKYQHQLFRIYNG